MRSLVLYYSQTGNTEKVATLLAKALHADIARYACHAYEGRLGGLRQAWDVFTGGTPPIELPDEAGNSYDLVVVAGPVWAARPAPPVRSLLKRRLPVGRHLAIVLTCDGSSTRFPGEKALGEASNLTAGKPLALGLFKAADIQNINLPAKIGAFTASLRAAAATFQGSAKVIALDPAARRA
ncbi:flavodoxin family protein [Pelagibacterium halotolerans]|uniref:flavodoxin family protein n=1 Tax=Pelagibacterium halotolerans TaxID=531813 RepID=UPI00384A96A8